MPSFIQGLVRLVKRGVPFYLLLSFSPVLYAQPVYTFARNADLFLKFAFPTPCVPVNLTVAFEERTRRFAPTNFDQIMFKNNVWGDVTETQAGYPIPEVGIESYWLSLLGRNGNYADLIPSQLLAETNTSGLIAICSNLMSEKWAFSSPAEKALFQRDVFQLYYVYVNCTNYTKTSLPGNALAGRDRTLASLRGLLDRLRLDARQYQRLANDFVENLNRGTRDHPFEEDNPFDPALNFLPLRRARDGAGWFEMRFDASQNRHFNHYGGRSFVRVFARVPGWSPERFYAYWDEVYDKFGDWVHLNSHVPALPAGSQFMLVRTFSVLMQDGTVTDSGIPEEILIRAFKTAGSAIDCQSSDFRGTYYYVYKLNRHLFLTEPASLGLVRYSDTAPTFYGFYQDVPDLNTSRDAGVATVRYNCISCHALVHYGSSTLFSLERPRLKEPGADPFSGMLLRAVPGKPSKYVWGQQNENLGLDQ